MKAIRSNTRPTPRSTTKDNNEKDSTKDEDDGSILILAPPCTQLERQKGHHVTFGIINLSTSKELKGPVITDLPGRFPFTSSKNSNYIICMYDYDSNAVWSHPIRSRESPGLIIGINACYKVLEDTNITPIIHRLDNEISDDIIHVIEKKGLKHQISTSHDPRPLSAPS